MISRNEVTRLSGIQETICISIYIPTHRFGVETLKGQDSINLKNQVEAVKGKLSSQGVTENEADELLKPVMELIRDNDFWRHQQEGLAVFLSRNIFEKYVLPVHFDEYNYISNEFYIVPLLSLFNGSSEFYLLTLQKSSVNLYKGDKFGLNERNVQGMPSQLEDVVGYDFQQDRLQFRTTPGGGSFHGHGEGDADAKIEVLKFFRSVDKAISAELKNEKAPLVLCCIDSYFHIYQEANTYKNLYPENISCNFGEENRDTLFKKASALLQPYFNQNYPAKLNQFLESFDKGRASSDIKEIVPATYMGKADTLFVEKGADLFGVYDPASQILRIEDEHREPNVSLINLAAKKTFEQGGTVYYVEKGYMPDGSSMINALYRY